MTRQILRDPESGINTNLTVETNDTGEISLYLDGEVIPGQTAAWIERSSCARGYDQTVYAVTITFEVLGDKHRGRGAPVAADTPEDVSGVQGVLDV